MVGRGGTTVQKVFVMYKLKPGVTLEEYRQWSVTLDQRITPFQPGVIRFEVYAIKGAANNGESPYQIVEDIEVDDWETWDKVSTGEGMKEVAETWGRYGDESTLTIIYGDKVK
jgi:hypothetical protein